MKGASKTHVSISLWRGADSVRDTRQPLSKGRRVEREANNYAWHECSPYILGCWRMQ